MADPEITREQMASSKLDVLAAMAARYADDEEGALAVWRNCDQVAFVPSAMALLTDTLDELGVDIREWIARTRAGLLAGLAEGG